jgi:hypothetical protein
MRGVTTAIAVVRKPQLILPVMGLMLFGIGVATVVRSAEPRRFPLDGLVVSRRLGFAKGDWETPEGAYLGYLVIKTQALQFYC